jgi:hypothetical protein
VLEAGVLEIAILVGLGVLFVSVTAMIMHDPNAPAPASGHTAAPPSNVMNWRRSIIR